MPQVPRTPLTQAKRAQLTERWRPGGSPEVGTGPVGFRFTEARHGLTAQQCVQANQLLRHLERTRPILETGDRWQAKMGLRVAGVLSCVKGNRVGNRRWGKRMMGKRAGKVMALHALAHLRAWSPIGRLAAMVNREKRAAQEVWEHTGEVLPIGTPPTESVEAQHLRTIQEAWEEQQWQQQKGRLQW